LPVSLIDGHAHGNSGIGVVAYGIGCPVQEPDTFGVDSLKPEEVPDYAFLFGSGRDATRHNSRYGRFRKRGIAVPQRLPSGRF